MFKIRISKDFPGIGSINGFKIERYATSLLGGVKADVTIKYTNKKEVMIYGDEADVYQESLKRIKLIKNLVKQNKWLKSLIHNIKVQMLDQELRLAKV
jgi:hypothetical protein